MYGSWDCMKAELGTHSSCTTEQGCHVLTVLALGAGHSGTEGPEVIGGRHMCYLGFREGPAARKIAHAGERC